MPATSVKVNYAQIKAKLNKALGSSEKAKRISYQKAYGVYYNARRAMLRAFDSHPVTVEIDGGPNAINISDTLDGYGNLFSFIGFDESDNPIFGLRALLEVGTSFHQTVYRNNSWYFKIQLPSMDAIEKETPMPWEPGFSWVDGIEKGMTGLSNYLFKRWAGSRSGTGVQLPHENWGDALNFKPVPYISEILEKFRDKVSHIK